ncbi:MAG: aquaporin, partial [Thermomicrobiales bacterium]
MPCCAPMQAFCVVGGTAVDEGLMKRLLAEAIGTFLLVFVGCGAVVTNTVNADGASGLISIAFAFGFALMVV